MKREIETFRVEDIEVVDRKRAVDPDVVASLAKSIDAMGLRTPITVRVVDEFVYDNGEVVYDALVLVTGLHRLEAVKQLGWERIECFIFEGDDEIDAALWEISENLHRADLTQKERADQVAEWLRLTDEKETGMCKRFERNAILHLAQTRAWLNDECNGDWPGGKHKFNVEQLLTIVESKKLGEIEDTGISLAADLARGILEFRRCHYETVIKLLKSQRGSQIYGR